MRFEKGKRVRVVKDGLRETGSEGCIVGAVFGAEPPMFFVGLDRKQAPWRGCYTADELEVVELSTPHIQLPSQEYVAQMREKALHESICAAGLGHFLANPRVLAERGHFVVLDDGREQFVLDGKPMVEFGPLTIETVPEKIGQTAIRMFRSVKALV